MASTSRFLNIDFTDSYGMHLATALMATNATNKYSHLFKLGHWLCIQHYKFARDASAYTSATVAAAIISVDQMPNTINIIFIANDLEAENTYKVHGHFIPENPRVISICCGCHVCKKFKVHGKFYPDNGHPQDVCMEDTYIDQTYGLTPGQFLRMFTFAWMSGAIKLLETKKPPTGHFLF
ncbi:hypothetical protein SELMODRAFT_429242 [Selaginella moellendorffii]|uniref:Uncharacterized protein n=1 Tax=Selaginella moellendorffii TaxID=88036 RepID=D8T5I6_SELML|nr:hypothetical protein SELMODRAFT_429242 [Selaginella moellendorffii]